MRERAVIQRGQVITATVSTIENSFIANRKEANINGLRVTLNYTPPGQPEQREAPGRLQPQDPPQVAVGDRLEVKVDPSNPRVWTARKTPKSWAEDLALVLGLIPVLVALVLLMFWNRARVMSVWRNGVEATAVVVGTGQSAIAPFSRVVRYALADGTDPRVFSLLCPGKYAPQKGQAVAIVHAPGNPGRAVLAELYL
jgi:hypothetical protein